MVKKTDGRKDGRTDGQTDVQPDRSPVGRQRDIYIYDIH